MQKKKIVMFYVEEHPTWSFELKNYKDKKTNWNP
jgi:hypothetical protein